jgi:hypothetical protein
MRNRTAHERDMWRRQMKVDLADANVAAKHPMTTLAYHTDLVHRAQVNAEWLARVAEHYRQSAEAGINTRSLFVRGPFSRKSDAQADYDIAVWDGDIDPRDGWDKL